MKKNVGTIDKVIRFVLAGGVAALFFTNVISGTALLAIMGIIVLVFLGTALTGFCPLYTFFGFSSCPVKEAQLEKDGQ